MEFLSQWPIVGIIISVIVALNIALTGIQKALEVVMDKTKTDVDNKSAAAIGKVVGLLSKLVDAIGFNPKH